ncbi:MAG: sugar transferase [Cellvibrio sp.]|nr:sugar transferase [Cellvibrio sp.]
MKRFLDFMIASIGVIILIPVFIFLVLLLLAFQGRPVFFIQERVGLNGVTFTLYKFRTMENCSRSRLGSFDIGNTSRVTKIGRILRATKLDELPQLFNVLAGDMSLVGPRPEVRKWVDVYPARWAYIHTVRPGITDPASIKYRNEETLLSQSANPEETYRFIILPQKLSIYEAYINSRSTIGDVKIILATLIAVFK